MRYFARIIFVLLFGLCFLAREHYTPAALAQDDYCKTWQSILDGYQQINDADAISSVRVLEDLRSTLLAAPPPPETSDAYIALLNLLYLKTLILMASGTDQGELEGLAESWTPEAIAAHDNAIRLVSQHCKGDLSPMLLIADFNRCSRPNNLGGDMGAAYSPPNKLMEKYVPDDPSHGCVARLQYQITEWAAFWMKLNGADLSPYSKLVFDIKADAPAPQQIKIELKRAGTTEWVTTYVAGISNQWKPLSVPFSSFSPVPWAAPLSSLEDMEELVFTFELNTSGMQGVVYLDNIVAQ